MKFRHRRISRDVTLSSITYGAQVDIEPIQRDPVILVQMPRAGGALAHFNKSSICLDASSHAIIDVRRIQAQRFTHDFDALVLRIRISRLLEHLEILLGRKPTRDLEFLPSFDCSSSDWSEWSLVAPSLEALDALERTEISPHILPCLEETILSALLVAPSNNFSEELGRPGRSLVPKHVKRAESYIEQMIRGPLTVAGVANHLGVSVRSLFDGFKTFRGVSPGEFIRNSRLEKAREDLLSGQANVADVASKWGYAHLGNFAARYRDRFHELPSETARFGLDGDRRRTANRRK